MASLATAPKTLAEAPSLAVIPPPHGVPVIPHGFADPNDPQFSIPVFDFVALTSNSPDERSKLLFDLGEVCRNWGFFILTNHGVPESLTKGMMEAFSRFFQQPKEEKMRLKTSDTCNPVQYGMNFTSGHWREFYKVRVNPDFHAADDTVDFSEVSKEFGKRVKEVEERLIEAISESLDLEGDYIYKALNMDDALQSVAGNLYPPCTQPDLTVGLIPHSDATLITLLVENGISGLQVEHNEKWLKVENKIPSSFCVFVGDYLQILTNGKYKSVAHQACVNDRATRMTIVIPYGPPINTAVAPSPELLKKERQIPLYEAMTFRDYIKLKRTRGIVNTTQVTL